MQRLLISVVVLLAVKALAVDAISDLHREIEQRYIRGVQHAPCTRLMDVENSFGCTSPEDGSVGSLYLIESSDQLTEYLGNSERDEDHVVVLAATLATPSNLHQLEAIEEVAGVILTDDKESLTQYSPARSTLASYTGQREWNPAGNGLMYEDFQIPIVTMRNVEADTITALAAKNTKDDAYPKQSVRINYYMGPKSLRATQCIQDLSCLPLGGQSIWGSLGRLDSQKSYVLLTSPLDSPGWFHDYVDGSLNGAAGIAVLVGAIEALNSSSLSALESQILFTSFQGESWNRIGSRRWVKDVAHFTCQSVSKNGQFCQLPVRSNLLFQDIALSNVKHVLSLDQLGTINADSPRMYYHQAPGNNAEAQRLQAIMQAADASAQGSSDLIEVKSSSQSAVPPSSLDTFLEAKATKTGAVLGGFDSTFEDPFYASRFSSQESVDLEYLTRACTTIARVTYALALPDSVQPADALNAASSISCLQSTVEAWHECITSDGACGLFQELTGLNFPNLASISGAGRPVSMYTSVYYQPYVQGNGYVINPSILELTLRNFLVTSTGNPLGVACRSLSDCNNGADVSTECVLGQCWNLTAYYHDAVSVALDPTPVFNVWTINATDVESDPTILITEPYWSGNVGVRLFSADNTLEEVMLFVMGIAVTLGAIGFLVFFFIPLTKKHFKQA